MTAGGAHALTSTGQSARIPILPVLEFGNLLPGASAHVPSVRDVGIPLWLERGAHAIYLALRHAGIGAGDEVLMPAYHCPSMIAPATAAGADVGYFAVDASLRVLVAAVERRMSMRSRALLIPHFFGRLQDLRELRSFADRQGLVMIEDCAHAYFGAVDERPVGSTGHYAIASPRKFFCSPEGGLLTSADRSLQDLAVRAPGLLHSARAIFDTIDAAVSHRRLPMLRPVVALAKALSGRRRSSASQMDAADSAGAGNRLRWAPLRCDPVARALIAQGRKERLVQRRRRNYALLAKVVADLPGFRTLDLGFDDHAVPYMLPLIMRNAEQQFPAFKRSRLPVWRWEHSALGWCEVTDDYARSMVQIPCHQSLTVDELQYMSTVLREVSGLA